MTTRARHAGRSAESDSTPEPGKGGLLQQMLKIAALASPYAGKIALGAMLVLAGTGVSLVFPLAISAVIDTAVDGGDIARVHALSFVILLLFLLRSAVSFLGTYALESTGEYLVLDLKSKLFKALLALDIEFFKQQKLGELTSRLNTDTAAIRSVATDTAVSIVNQLLMLIGSCAMMLALNWRLTLVIIALAPLTTMVSRRFGAAVHHSARQVRDSTANTAVVAHESMSGIAVVKSMSREHHEAGRYQRALEHVRSDLLRSIWINTWFRTTVMLLTSLSTVAIFWYGGLQVFYGRISAGELVAFLFYVQNITQAFSGFAQLYANVNQAAGASMRAFELLDMYPSIRSPDDARTLTEPRGELVFDGVEFAHMDGAGVLHDFNLKVGAGEILVLAGKSGCGKTTAINLLPRLYDPNRGCVLFDGVDVRTLSLEWLREQIALVSQDVFLFGGTILDNIRYGKLDADDEDVRRAAELAEAHGFIERLPEGYMTEVGERGVKLSGGQRQRIALARAFLRSPKLLVLDEGTSGIDSATEARIYESVIRWSRSTGTTVLIVAHRSSAMPLADRIVLMDAGRILEEGTYEALLAQNGQFAEMIENASSKA